MCTYTAFDSMMTVSNCAGMLANTNVNFIQNNHCEQRATHVASLVRWPFCVIFAQIHPTFTFAVPRRLALKHVAFHPHQQHVVQFYQSHQFTASHTVWRGSNKLLYDLKFAVVAQWKHKPNRSLRRTWIDVGVQKQNVTGMISIGWLVDVAGSSLCHPVRCSFDTISGWKTVTAAVLETVSRCDTEPAF